LITEGQIFRKSFIHEGRIFHWSYNLHFDFLFNEKLTSMMKTLHSLLLFKIYRYVYLLSVHKAQKNDFYENLNEPIL